MKIEEISTEDLVSAYNKRHADWEDSNLSLLSRLKANDDCDKMRQEINRRLADHKP